MTYSVLSLRIAPNVLKEIDALATDENVERSTLLRDLLNKGLKQTKMEHAVEQYKQGNISIGRMAKVTGLPRHELFKELKKHNVNVHYSKDRLLMDCHGIISQN